MPCVYSGGKQTASRFLINNVKGVDVAKLATLARAAVIEPVVMNGLINKKLNPLLSKLPYGATPLVIYPGNGANQLSGMLSTLSSLQSMSVAAKRQWQPGQNPVCEVQPFNLPDRVTHVLIVDDVISSGGTMCAVREGIPSHIECWAIAQVSQRLGKSRKKVMRDFGRVIVGAELCGEAVSLVPINSVSTLCADSGLAISYAERHIPCELRSLFISLL